MAAAAYLFHGFLWPHNNYMASMRPLARQAKPKVWFCCSGIAKFKGEKKLITRLMSKGRKGPGVERT